MLIKLHTATLQGLTAIPIQIETDSYSGGPQPRFTIVGLPDNAVKESQERISAAIRHNGYRLPSKSVVINLAPADIKKEGSGFDVPMALSVLAAHEMLRTTCPLDRCMFVGELGLDGTILPIRGALPIAIKAREMGFDALFVPKDNGREAAVVNRLKVYAVDRLSDIIKWLEGTKTLEPTVVHTREEFFDRQNVFECDFVDVRGQENVKRAMEVAAAGGHNMIIIGNPGCGKSMMAKRLPTILPPLSLSESLETTQIHSVAGKLGRDVSLISQRPFRAPHHTISDVALVGGGNTFSPGEICLAHNGVLFLDELPEYNRSVLETLRQPLEDREITISRARYNLTLPCSFMMVASMNPCPCGYLHHPTHACTCTPTQIIRYLNRISGPLMDRIDIQVEAMPMDVNLLAVSNEEESRRGESSASIRERVVRAREIQTERFSNHKGIHCNAQMTPALMQIHCGLDAECADVLRLAMKRLDLSARAYDRILKVARTIADLEGSPSILRQHIGEAVGYRSMDREGWYENR